MTAPTIQETYKVTTNQLSEAIMGMEALTVLLVNALHYESSIVGSYADGISILLWEKVDALKGVEERFPNFMPERGTSDETAKIAEEVERINHARSMVEEEIETIRSEEIAAALKVDADIVQRVVRELNKAKTPTTRPDREGRRGRTAAS